MDIFSVFTLGGGLAFFLYALHALSTGLEKMAGGKLEQMLRKMTNNPFKSLLLGAGITSSDSILLRNDGYAGGPCQLRHYGSQSDRRSHYGLQCRNDADSLDSEPGRHRRR